MKSIALTAKRFYDSTECHNSTFDQYKAFKISNWSLNFELTFIAKYNVRFYSNSQCYFSLYHCSSTDKLKFHSFGNKLKLMNFNWNIWLFWLIARKCAPDNQISHKLQNNESTFIICHNTWAGTHWVWTKRKFNFSHSVDALLSFCLIKCKGHR